MNLAISLYQKGKVNIRRLTGEVNRTVYDVQFVLVGAHKCGAVPTKDDVIIPIQH